MSNLVRVDERATSGLARAEETWTPEHREALARYLGVAPDNPALFPMMAVCAAWGLDPFAGQVWLIKQKGRDADGAEKWRPAAGRDGYLAIANRQPDYIGITGDVVREKDVFSVRWLTGENGMRPLVEHSYEQGPGENGEMKVRGGILGAWAVLFRDGRLPVYYFAPWLEHRRDPEKSAWSYRSAMILKAAQSMALRLGYSITGLVPVDEMAVGLGRDQEQVVEAPPERPWTDDDLPWGDDELGGFLRFAVEQSWQTGSREWNRARLAMLLTGDRQALLERIQATIPDPDEAPESRGEADPTAIEDAEVVPETP